MILLATITLTDNLSASSWADWIPNTETFTSRMPSSPQWANQLASGWTSLSPIQQRAALATLLGLGVGGGYYGWNQRQQRLAAEQQQRLLAEAQRLYQERVAESDRTKNSILDALAPYIDGLRDAPPSTIEELKRVTDAINTIAVELIQPKISSLTSNDQQAIKQQMNWLINKIEEQKQKIAEWELIQRSKEELQREEERRAGEEMLKMANEGLFDIEQDLAAIKKEREQEELQKAKGKEEAESFIKEQVQAKVNEYNDAILALETTRQQYPGNEDAKRHVYTELSKLIESIENDKLVKIDASQQERLTKTAQWLQSGIYPQAGQVVPSSLPSSSSSSSSQVYEPSQSPAEQRSIPIITIQNMYGSPLEIGAKFKNGITKKSYPIDNNKFLTLHTNVNVSEWDQNQFQPVAVKQEGSATDLLLTREPLFITYRAPGKSFLGYAYTTYGVDVSKYVNDKNIKAVVIRLHYNASPTTTLTFKDNSQQTIEETPLTNP